MTNSRGLVGWVAAGTALTFFIPAAALHLMKRQAGEYSEAEVVAQQAANPRLLYLSGLDQSVSFYKSELTDRLRPEVVVLGSSRAMQVRTHFFNVPAVNWGGAVNSLAQLDWTANHLIALPKKPALAVIFVDTWWFNDSYQNSAAVYAPRERTAFTNLYSNTSLLFRAVVRQGLRANAERIGIAALRSNQGYDAGGSFHYVAAVFYPNAKDTDTQFQTSLKQMTIKAGRWAAADNASDSALNRFRNIVKRLEAANIKVVAIMPPFAAPVTSKFAEDPGYRFVGDLRKKLSGEVFDYTDLSSIPGANHCEFIDGSHAGEVVYARALALAARSQPRLAALLSPKLAAWIETNAGKASPTSAQYAGNRKELDFLEIGCKR